MLTKCLLYKMSPLLYVSLLKCEIIVNSSKKLCVGRHQRMEFWGHPWDDYIQTPPQLDPTNPGMKIGSGMIQGSKTSSFSLQHRLQDGPLAHPQLLKMLDLLQIMTFWYQVNETHFYIDLRENSLRKVLRILNFECFRMWIICVVGKCL